MISPQLNLDVLTRDLSHYLENQVKVGLLGSGVGLSLVLGFSAAYTCYYLISVAKVKSCCVLISMKDYESIHTFRCTGVQQQRRRRQHHHLCVVGMTLDELSAAKTVLAFFVLIAHFNLMILLLKYMTYASTWLTRARAHTQAINVKAITVHRMSQYYTVL